MVTLIVLICMVGLIFAGLIYGVAPWVIALAVGVLPTALGLVLLSIKLLPLHVVASNSGAGLTLGRMYLLAMRRVPIKRVIDVHSRLSAVGEVVDAERVIELHEAGGDIEAAAEAVEIMAGAGVSLRWDEVSAWQLSGVDVRKAAIGVAMERRAGRMTDFDTVCRSMAGGDEVTGVEGELI